MRPVILFRLAWVLFFCCRHRRKIVRRAGRRADAISGYPLWTDFVEPARGRAVDAEHAGAWGRLVEMGLTIYPVSFDRSWGALRALLRRSQNGKGRRWRGWLASEVFYIVLPV